MNTLQFVWCGDDCTPTVQTECTATVGNCE